MDSFAVINIVAEVLKNLLSSGLKAAFMNNIPGDFVVLQSPKELATEASSCLSLFLYQVVENAYVKNQPMRPVLSGQLQYPPLALDCYYLLTPYVDEQTNVVDIFNTHRVLGRAMQVLYDNAILRGPALMTILENLTHQDFYNLIEEIRVILNPISLDDLTKLWNSLNTPLRLSVSYEVRIIMIESEKREEVRRVVEKEDHYYQVQGRIY